MAAGDALLAVGELQRLARVAQSNEKAAGIGEKQEREKRKLSDAQTAVARYQTALDELRKEAQAKHANRLMEGSVPTRRTVNCWEESRAIVLHLSARCGNLTLDQFIAQVCATNLDLLAAELDRMREEIRRLEDAKAKNVSERDGIDREFQLREAATALSNATCEKFSPAARIDALASGYLEQQLTQIVFS